MGEELLSPDPAEFFPPGRVGGHGVPRGLVEVVDADGVRDGPVREGVAALVEYLGRDLRGRGDDGELGAEAEGHERAVGFGELGQGLVGLAAELEDVADYRKGARPRGKVCTGASSPPGENNASPCCYQGNDEENKIVHICFFFFLNVVVYLRYLLLQFTIWSC